MEEKKVELKTKEVELYPLHPSSPEDVWKFNAVVGSIKPDKNLDCIEFKHVKPNGKVFKGYFGKVSGWLIEDIQE